MRTSRGRSRDFERRAIKILANTTLLVWSTTHYSSSRPRVIKKVILVTLLTVTLAQLLSRPGALSKSDFGHFHSSLITLPVCLVPGHEENVTLVTFTTVLLDTVPVPCPGTIENVTLTRLKQALLAE